MSLAERLAESDAVAPSCRVGEILADPNLGADDLRALVFWLASKKTSSSITKALHAEGYAVGETTVRRHRKEGHTCGTQRKTD